MIKINPQIPSAVVAYPSYCYRDSAEPNWRLRVAGVVWQSPVVVGFRQRMMIKLLVNAMRATPEEIDCEMFRERVEPFIADPTKRMKVMAQIGDQTFPLKKKTRGNGHFQSWLRIPDSTIQQMTQIDESGQAYIPYQVILEQTPEPVSARAYLMEDHGISVISDIDDTIKDSDVSDRRELLHNTFLREFRNVDGMADLYREWSASGVSFHYVSSSPWQLFNVLDQWRGDGGFPTGTLHLRKFRLRDQLLKKVLIFRRKGKAKAIKQLLKRMPNREFVLIGDSGEKDPEIYHKIVKKFPGRIKGLFIRELPERPIDEERAEKIFGSQTQVDLVGKYSNHRELAEIASPLFQKAVV